MDIFRRRNVSSLVVKAIVHVESNQVIDRYGHVRQFDIRSHISHVFLLLVLVETDGVSQTSPTMSEERPYSFVYDIERDRD